MRTTILTAFAAALIATSVQAQQAPPAAPVPPPAPYGEPLSYEQARRVLDAVLAEGRRNGWKLAVTVVEPTGEMIAFGLDEGAGYGASEVSQAKARTAARFGRDTRAFADSLNAGRMWPLAIDGMVPVEGGVPIVVDGRTIGAVGVSGATAAQDGQAARAGAAAAAGS